MGAWGFSIVEDDTASDIYARYIDLFNRGYEHSQIVDYLVANEPAFEDVDDRSAAWFAVARAQWDCGALQPAVKAKVELLISQNDGTVRWEESGPLAVRKRQKALQLFFAKLGETNRRPKKPRTAVKRPPVFQAGDCLAMKLSDGDWGAVLVLKASDESEDPYVETYGSNLFGLLRYKSRALPPIELFVDRQWLVLTHTTWRPRVEFVNVGAHGFRKWKARFVVVGSIPILASDPSESPMYVSWSHLDEEVIRQDKWNRDFNVPEQ